VELGTPERTQSPNGAVDEQQAATGEAEHHPELRFPVRETRGQIPSRYTALAQQDPGAQQNQWGFTMIAIHLAMIANQGRESIHDFHRIDPYIDFNPR
jgi:hypothetical protein